MRAVRHPIRIKTGLHHLRGDLYLEISSPRDQTRQVLDGEDQPHWLPNSHLRPDLFLDYGKWANLSRQNEKVEWESASSPRLDSTRSQTMTLLRPP
jgi:hypothetical protein